METQQKITRLRELMRQHQIDAWIVPSSDPHQSEYVADCWQARAWLSGFHGSAGTVVVTQEHAGLWTDSRYHIRAVVELASSGITLHKKGLDGVADYPQWLRDNLPDGATVGFDGAVVSIVNVNTLERTLRGKEIEFVSSYDFVGELWLDRPKRPQNPIFLHDLQFTGETRQSKLTRIRKRLGKAGCNAHLLTALDDIAWTLNIRGSDVAHNPVAICYAVITQQDVTLFIDSEKVPQAVRTVLETDGVVFAEYDAMFTALNQLSAETVIRIDPQQVSQKLKDAIAPDCRVVQRMSLPRYLKSVKNVNEIGGFRQSHVRDGVALVKWLVWLEGELGRNPHTEITVADKLTEFRGQGAHFRGLSFGTISGYAANSAIGHYKPDPATTPDLHAENILLIDSGGQYLDGTTDVTRTIALGTPTAEPKRIFTVVLQSLIYLSTAKFLKGTNGQQLDALAREPLWQHGLNCRHGIGHGVGSYLNVHEGPHGISAKKRMPFEPGMVVTIEPGVYFEGAFGVRLENMVSTVSAETTQFGDFYAFETMTLCPFDQTLIDFSLLTSAEIDWLNTYHQRVYETLAPHLTASERAWLEQKTRDNTQ